MSRIQSFFLSGLSILMLLGGNFRLGQEIPEGRMLQVPERK